MSDDLWAEAYNRLTSALEYAREIGMTDEEIEDCVEDTKPTETVHVGGGPKGSKKKK